MKTGSIQAASTTMFSTRRDVRRSVSGIPSHEQNEAFLAPSLGQKRLRLRGHPHNALQRAARVRRVERRALQALHHAGRALPHRLWTRVDPCRGESPRSGSHRTIRQNGRGGAGRRAGAARLVFQAVWDHLAGVCADAALAGVSPLRFVLARHRLWGALRSAARGVAALLLDLRGGGARHPRPRPSGQPVSGLDRHLCGRGIPRRGACRNRRH